MFMALLLGIATTNFFFCVWNILIPEIMKVAYNKRK